jgi:hypothetical protein
MREHIAALAPSGLQALQPPRFKQFIDIYGFFQFDRRKAGLNRQQKRA